jgi:hypothetical protein
MLRHGIGLEELSITGSFFAFLDGFINRTHHVERLLRQMIALTTERSS